MAIKEAITRALERMSDRQLAIVWRFVSHMVK